MKVERRKKGTEDINPRTVNIDRIAVPEAVDLFLKEDRAAFQAVKNAAAEIVQAIELVVKAFEAGGRLIYLGAGTSGRIGFLDAAECPPTFGVPAGMVSALMAGGEDAFRAAVEGAEDDSEAAVDDLKRIDLKKIDVVLGITASGTTPYVRSGLDFAKNRLCRTILVACNPVADKKNLDVVISLLVGPEVISGSTRLKSGTACKMVLNMISTISMVRIGKVYKNLMVDVVATNQKLRKRARRIVMIAGNVDEETAGALLEKTSGEVKTAIYLAKKGGSVEQARLEIQRNGGFLARALGEI